jgi:hypothetical protein
MGILAHPPEDFRKLRLYELVQTKSDTSDGAAERAESFIRAATPLVDLIIAGPMREFTLHNRDHSKKLLHLAEYVNNGLTPPIVDGAAKRVAIELNKACWIR